MKVLIVGLSYSEESLSLSRGKVGRHVHPGGAVLCLGAKIPE